MIDSSENYKTEYIMENKSLKLALNLLVTILVLVMSSCEREPDCCTIIDVNVQILYKNNLGKNLINSSANFDESNIKVYYKNGNKFDYIYNGNLDSPNMHRVDKDENENLVLIVYPSNFYEGNKSTTLIELNQNVVDTLVCEFELGSNKQICKKSWLNGIEMNNRFIEIKK